MDLLEKFDAVVIRTDDRITEADRKYCQSQQELYQDAVQGFYQIACLWMDMCVCQKNALADPDDYREKWKKKYLISSWWPNRTVKDIIRHIFSLHEAFINEIVSYLNDTYHLSIGTYAVERNLIPEEPQFYETDDVIDWAAFPPVVLRYEDIVDFILSGFGGRTFEEQAPYELVEHCHIAAWDKSTHTANFERKKSTIKILHGACDYGYYSSHNQWHINDSAKHIIKALAHFETGGFDRFPSWLDSLSSDRSYLWDDEYELEGVVKLERIKLFKNGRMDIRFTSEAYALQFIADYLGTVE